LYPKTFIFEGTLKLNGMHRLWMAHCPEMVLVLARSVDPKSPKIDENQALKNFLPWNRFAMTVICFIFEWKWFFLVFNISSCLHQSCGNDSIRIKSIVTKVKMNLNYQKCFWTSSEICRNYLKSTAYNTEPLSLL